MPVPRFSLCVLPLATFLFGSPALAGSIELTNIQLFSIPFGAEQNTLAINDEGAIAGSSFPFGGPQEGFVIPAGGGAPIQIVAPGSQLTSVGGINNQGTLAGFYFGNDNTIHGFTYSGGTYTPVSAGSNGLTYPVGINNQGDVAGYFLTNPNGPSGYSGFLDKGGVITHIVFPGYPQDTYLMAVNDLGQVAGYYNYATQGFIRNPDGSFITFGFAPTGLNNAGIAVGSGPGGNDNSIGEVYVDGGTYTYVYPGAYDTYLQGINNLDEVVGSYSLLDGSEEIFVGHLVLVGVPEPSTISLCALALLALSGIASRRRKLVQ